MQALSLAMAAMALLTRTPAQAQSGVVDEGTFMITRAGAPVGRESFRIIRSAGAGGQVFRAVSQSAIGDRRMTTTLATDSLGAPVFYEATTTQRGRQPELLRGRGRPDRFSAMVQTQGGESSREYLIEGATILLDDDIFHQFFFAGLALDSTLRVISPRTARSERVRVIREAPQALVIGDQTITALHFAFADSSGTRREVWLDPRGRVLKVSAPDKALVALRDDPPR